MGPWAHLLFQCVFKGCRKKRHSPDIFAPACAVLFPYFSLTHGVLTFVTAHLQPPTQGPSPPAELKRENLKIVNTARSVKRKRGWEKEGEKLLQSKIAEAVLSSGYLRNTTGAKSATMSWKFHLCIFDMGLYLSFNWIVWLMKDVFLKKKKNTARNRPELNKGCAVWALIEPV